MRNRGRQLRRWALLASAVLLTGASHGALDTRSREAPASGVLPSPEQIQLVTLGFDGLVADAYWVQAVQLAGSGGGGPDAQTERLARLVELVTELDPWVGHAYRFAALWLTDSPASVLRANRLLARGISYHPGDWRNRHYLGFNNFFYLGDQAAAARVLAGAVGLPGAPAYLGPLVARLQTRGGGLDTSAAFLAGLARDSDDEYARAEYLKALDEIQTERHARVLDGARRAYRERHGRDIAQLSDLVRAGLLSGLPPAHPHFEGFAWELHPETDEIVSSYYGARYAPYAKERDRERRRRWRAALEDGA